MVEKFEDGKTYRVKPEEFAEYDKKKSFYTPMGGRIFKFKMGEELECHIGKDRKDTAFVHYFCDDFMLPKWCEEIKVKGAKKDECDGSR